MIKIIQFPKKVRTVIEIKQADVSTTPKAAAQSAEAAALVKGIWVFTVLMWPLLKWVISIDCFFQLVRIMYHWNTPGEHAGLTFMMHFAILIALTYYVSIYKPKGL